MNFHDRGEILWTWARTSTLGGSRTHRWWLFCSPDPCRISYMLVVHLVLQCDLARTAANSRWALSMWDQNNDSEEENNNTQVVDRVDGRQMVELWREIRCSGFCSFRPFGWSLSEISTHKGHRGVQMAPLLFSTTLFSASLSLFWCFYT